MHCYPAHRTSASPPYAARAQAGAPTISAKVQKTLDELANAIPRLNEELHRTMRKAYAAVREVADEFNVDLRRAAFILAIRRVAESARSRMYVSEDISI